MKLTNGEIYVAREPLQKLAEKALPVKTAYAVAKLSHKLGEQWKIIEETRNGLVRQYAEQDKNRRLSVLPTIPNPKFVPDGQEPEEIPNPKYEKFVADFNELMEQTVEVVFEVVRLPETVDGKALEIEPQILIALEKFVAV